MSRLISAIQSMSWLPPVDIIEDGVDHHLAGQDRAGADLGLAGGERLAAGDAAPGVNAGERHLVHSQGRARKSAPLASDRLAIPPPVMAMTMVRHNLPWDWSNLHTYRAGGSLVKATAAEVRAKAATDLTMPQHSRASDNLIRTRRRLLPCRPRGRQNAGRWTRPNVLSRKYPSVPMAARARVLQKARPEHLCMVACILSPNPSTKKSVGAGSGFY